MKKTAHIFLAFFLCFLFVLLIGWLDLNWFYFTLKSLLVIFFVIIFYALLPDIDHKSGTMTWFFLSVGILGVITGICFIILKLDIHSSLLVLVFSSILLVVTLISANFLKHRGIIHSIPVGLISIVPLFLLFGNWSYCLVAFVSFYSHLVGDGYLFKLW
jgi:hypothetical protein